MREFNQPLGGNEMPRFGGIASMFRLPVHSDATDLDVALVGVPLSGWDPEAIDWDALESPPDARHWV